ncbi:cell division protein ZapA [Kamptonema cortianum]|nr:cell division protein ZapA [Geitlerinema splendidum]MDK3158572.1 cell division protein ZapA [Kamptonema cortianum]
MKRVVSVSLGTSKRDKTHTTTILGQEFTIERRGTDGNRERFRELVRELDGKVDAIGVGGADIWVATSKKRYAFRDVLSLVSHVQQSAVVDGSGLKQTLERETITKLQVDGTVDFRNERALMVSAVDRFGMAQALDRVCPDVLYGDFYFGLGIPLPIRSYRWVEILAGILLPVITQMPIQWFYPTGEKQEQRTPKFPKIWEDRTFVCGDWHYIRRYAPDILTGKTILTQTLRSADLAWLKSAGVSRAITTTPSMGGETFATNVMEGVIVSLLEKPRTEITDSDYLDVLRQLDWKPNVIKMDSVSVD